MIRLFDLLNLFPISGDYALEKDSRYHIRDNKSFARYLEGPNGEILLNGEYTYLGYLDFFRKEVTSIEFLGNGVISIYVKS